MDRPVVEPEQDAVRAPLPVGVACPDCGYDLRGSTSARCPECGYTLDVLRSTESQIPWVHRRQLGWLRAYWKTVWLVFRRPERFCHEMARPVAWGDSQSFRWVTLLHAYLPILFGTSAWLISAQLRGYKIWAGDWWLFAGGLIWLLLVLATLPGLASYFFQWRRLSTEQQNRAIALSYYAWAGLAIVPAALPLWVAALVLNKPPWAYTTSNVLYTASLIWLPAALLVAYGTLQQFARHIAHESGLRRFCRMALLGALSLALSLAWAVIPLAAFFIAVIVASLR